MSRPRPLIGFAAHGHGADNRYLLPPEYLNAVRRAGGTALPAAPPEPCWEGVPGVAGAFILAGGGCIDPDRHGSRRGVQCGLVASPGGAARGPRLRGERLGARQHGGGPGDARPPLNAGGAVAPRDHRRHRPGPAAAVRRSGGYGALGLKGSATPPPGALTRCPPPPESFHFSMLPS